MFDLDAVQPEAVLACDELLIELTGQPGAWWVEFVQKRIPLYCTPTDNPAHPTCDASAWLRDLSDEVWSRVKAHNDLTKVDENVVSAAVVSIVTTLWGVRLRRAKTHDPRRPIGLRRQAFGRSLRYQLALVSCLIDQTQDSQMFELPSWDDPFAPDATNGDFV